MKTLFKSLLAIVVMALSVNAVADGKSDSTLLTECKKSVSAQFDSVDKIKVAGMNSRRGIFKAKLRVYSAGERSMMLCEIKDGVVAISCKKGCDGAKLALN